MSNKSYVITDLPGYVNRIRIEAANSIAENGNNDDLDSFISLGQIEKIVLDNAVDHMDKGPVIDENSNEKIVGEVITWMYNIALARLAAKGHLESAWDDEKNEMIFWKK